MYDLDGDKKRQEGIGEGNGKRAEEVDPGAVYVYISWVVFMSYDFLGKDWLDLDSMGDWLYYCARWMRFRLYTIFSL